jgi:predicted AAA+ superfamily ATPase
MEMWNRQKPFDFNTYSVTGTSENTFACQKQEEIILASSEEYFRQAIIQDLIEALNIQKASIELGNTKTDRGS